MRLYQLVFALSLVVCINDTAFAEPPPDVGGSSWALSLLADGNDKLDRGLWAEALKLFEDVYRVFPSPKLHFNIAQALYQLGRRIEALERYERFVGEINKEEHQTDWRLAQERVFELQDQIATIDIQCNAVGALANIDGRDVGKTPLPRPVRVLPGALSIVISKPGYERQVIEVTLKAGDTVTQRVNLLTEAPGSRQSIGSAAMAMGEAYDLPPSVLFARLVPSVVVVTVTMGGQRGQGSGIVIGREQIVTNKHVIDGATAIEVTQGRRTFTAGLASFDAAHDLAILRVPGLEQPRVTQRPSSLVQMGERVYAIGAPRGRELSLLDGLIAARRVDKGSSGTEMGAAMLQITTPISPGSSGGGLFDAQGRLVGITTFSALKGQTVNIALPTEWIAALEQSVTVGVPSSPPSPAIPHYSVTNRPEVLICTVQTQSTWGLFTSGAELLDTRAVRAVWHFERVNTQFPRLSAPKSARYSNIELVLVDFDRVARFVRFGNTERSVRNEYFFSINDEGAFHVTSLTTASFDGRLRITATSGPCEALSMATAAALFREREESEQNALRSLQEKRTAAERAQVEMRRRDRRRVLPVTISLVAGGAAVTVVGIALAGVGYGMKHGDRSGTLDQYLGSVTTINAERGSGLALLFIGLATAAAGAITRAHPPHIERRKRQATVTILPSLGGERVEGGFR